MKGLLCILLASLPLTAVSLDYPVDVEQNLAGTQLTYATQDYGSGVSGVRVKNSGQQAAKCTALFNTGSEQLRVRRTVDPGEETTLATRYHSPIVRLQLKLSCVSV
ncbi:3-phosphoglycerate kinase [Pseudomonas sp. H9]|uniref:3-phosphoglycerate kinase n=1 Tax=Pseudomonas sp. H9 TaxID=483968 RepID=UPI0010577660|nr:3-phosphoglycerate kinase [Pseudomonas sp. H9]TDF80804.1 3-phosphoglycerate kinase [Pseudomonas sp. H9]